jgi:hypothetical protein
MTESDKKYYDALERQREKHIRAISKAKYRGEKSVEWHEDHQLTPETLLDFKKVMKEADKEWEILQTKLI